MGAPLLSQKMPSKDSSRGFSSNLLCRLWLIQDMLGAASCKVVDHKVVEKIYCNNEVARARYVKSQEALISYGGGWKDLEADEVDLGKGILENPTRSTHNVQWEQWAGILERGRPESLRLFRLNPATPKKRAPGPGPIRKRDWKPIATKLLSNKEVVLHTDGERAYTLKLPKVFHCNVVPRWQEFEGQVRNSDN